MSTASMTISSSLGGTVLTATDTGTYSTIVSRILTISDANGTFIISYNMGTNLTQTYDIVSDAYLSFQLVVVDITGTFTATVNYLAEGIYVASFLNAMKNTGCSCKPQPFCNLFKAELNLVAAERFALSGLGVSSQYSITAANIYVNA